ncbi:PRC-barrel domain-containing protein [Dyadobacter subterraneus]|uniref:PRC-barrel domain-containing protein n=1 Tax=Dyadobacter subterraneus TaxID=2773304 RepID=A0ABR9WDN2_9BACT|nr:PRC-barrel domain-containing protein [Dyadobacter subterraneus]MBE9463602.1 PRC-barrel domain-containing protein [Dyadobacter subterraneus]
METSGNQPRNDRLEELGSSNFEIADGQPDIRGWKVLDVISNYVGQSDELIFDKTTQKVLYIVVNLYGNDIGLKQKRVLVPIGLASLHEQDDQIILAELASRELGSLPEYRKGEITPQTEASIQHAFTGLAAALAAGKTVYESHPENFYQHEHFDQSRFYGSRKLKD